MGCKLVVLSDLHAGEPRLGGHIRGDLADILLARAVHWLNLCIRPDAVAVLGDVADDGKSPLTAGWYQAIKSILGRLQCPVIVLPGNHDAPQEQFYEVFDRPPQWLDVAGVRVLPFLDEEMPFYNARRSKEDIERILRARDSFDGQIVCLQHVAVLPPRASECPYNVVNAEEVMAAMKQANALLSIGGHYHWGIDLIERDGMYFGAVDGLSRDMFGFWEIDIDGRDVKVRKRKLAIPRELELVDLHNHTPSGICGRNMDFPLAIRLAELFGLAAIGFAEHSDQLLMSRDKFSVDFVRSHSLEQFPPEQSRLQEYYDLFETGIIGRENMGFELECNFNGDVLLSRDDAEKASYLVGSVHSFKEVEWGQGDPLKVWPELLWRTQRLLEYGADIIAHPLRSVHQAGLNAPEWVMDKMVEMLREHNAAAEINFNYDNPPAQFYRKCLNAGVKITLASDSHMAWQVGLLWPHLDLLQECGIGPGDLKDVLADPRRRK